jgi:hypothetical protein
MAEIAIASQVVLVRSGHKSRCAEKSMVRAERLTKEQMDELIQMARRDRVLWEGLKDRETNQFNEDGTAKLPSLAMLVNDLVKSKYGPNHIFDIGSLIILLRYQTRTELGLPIK